ncbi:MAG: phosphatidylglycerol lysyltransferase domain-containing protein [Christensenellaceae bacterium]
MKTEREKMLDFKPLELKNKKLFDSYVLINQYDHSEASFSNMYTWAEAWDICMDTDKDALYLSMYSDVYQPFLLPPYLKDLSQSILPSMLKCEEYMLDKFGLFYLKCATPEMVAKIKQDCGDRYTYVYDEYNSEYLYNAKDLIELKGKKYHSKRNHVNAFLRDYQCEFLPYQDEYKEECIALQEEWAIEKQADERDAQEELLSIKKALNNFEELGFVGCVVKINGEIVGFSFGEQICKRTAIIHIEKAKAGINGLYTYLNQKFAATMWSHCQFINRAEDMGVEGIRKAKRSYYPVRMLEKYDVLLKSKE